jgi:hypothetical protein
VGLVAQINSGPLAETGFGPRMAGDNKLGLYRQCVGARRRQNKAKAKQLRRRIADTACCAKPRYGDADYGD